MGFTDAKAYEQAAAAVVTNPLSLHKLEAEDKDDVYYLESTNEFVIVSTDGYIRTYFKPDKGKDKMRILYPTPTIWNSHCIASFDEAGDEYYEAYEDKEIQQIAWSKYGFRTGVTGGNYDVTQVNVKGIPQSIISTVSSLKMNVYEQLISYLGNK